MRQLTITFFLFFSISWSCSDAGSSTIPNEPKAIVKAYQVHYDKNEFEAAKRLSTKKGQAQLDDIKRAIANESPDSTVFSTIFLDMDCEIRGNRAVCECLVKDNFEDRYKATYHLLQVNGQWLVDAPDEEFQIDSDERFKDFLREQEERKN